MSDDLSDWAARSEPYKDAANIDGSELLDEVVDAIRRYVVMPSDDALHAMALHIVATHGQPAWEIAPRFIFRSPTPRCGKSRAQTIHRYLSHRPIATVNISAAAMARIITAQDPPTIHLDEYDTVFGGKGAEKHEDLRGIINSGHQRGQHYIRWNAQQNELEEVPTFCIVTLTGIGRLPSTIEDRGIASDMRRRLPSERVTPFRERRDKPLLEGLGRRIHPWIRGNLAALREATPEMPVEDRDADTWEPLIIVADLAGGKWPDLAREACRTLCLGKRDAAELRRGEELIRDLHVVFGDDKQVTTADLLDRLGKLDESPWSKSYGLVKIIDINDRDLARLLKEYGVKSTKFRVGSSTPRGYRREDLEDAWLRHCSCDRCSSGVPPTT